MNEDFRRAVDEILKVVIFENWLRFYFINSEGDDEIKIELPEKTLDKIESLFPAYLPLARELNGKPLDFETSRNAILMFVLDYMEGKSLPRGLADKVLSSPEFQLRLRMFNAWVQAHEEQLDRGFMDFGTWAKLFGEWETGPGGQELAKRLAGAGG